MFLFFSQTANTRRWGQQQRVSGGRARNGDEDRCCRKSTPSYPIDYFNDLFLVDVVMRAERTLGGLSIR